MSSRPRPPCPQCPPWWRAPILSETINAAVGRADDHASRGDRRRGGDRVAGVELPPLLAARGVEDVQLAVARSDEDAAAGDDRRGVDARAGDELPRALAAGCVDRVNRLVASADEDPPAGDRGRRVVR